MGDREIRVVRDAIANSKQLMGNRNAVSNLLRIITQPEHGIDQALRALLEILELDIAYLCFFHEGRVISLYFQSTGQNLVFHPPADMSQAPSLPRVALFRHDGGTTLLGDIAIKHSCVFPFISGARLVGLIEVGRLLEAIPDSAFEKFVAILRKTSNAFLSVSDREIKVHQLHSAQKQLGEINQRLAAIYADSRDFIFSVDLSGKIVFSNGAPASMLGYPIGQTPEFLPLINPDFDFLCSMVRRLGVISDFEVILGKFRTGTVYCLISLSLDPLGELIHGIAKDITERVLLHQQLRAMNQELAQTNETLLSTQSQMIQQEKMASIGQLAAGVAHEINNPLSFVMSNFSCLGDNFRKITNYCHTLEERFPVAEIPELAAEREQIHRTTTDTTELLSESKEGFGRIMTIIRSLRDFSRTDLQGSLESCDLNASLDATINISRNSWKYVAEIEKDYQLDSMVECYSSEVNQVFLNLIVNAAQAISDTPHDGMGKIRVSTQLDGEWAVIKIVDNGPGVPPDLRLKIFDPFFTTKPIGQGTGLGLSLSYDIIVKKHGGSLSVGDNEGGGAVFTIRLPVRHRSEKEAPNVDVMAR